MARRQGWIWLALLCSCAPSLSAQIVRDHPSRTRSHAAPPITARSEPERPSWIEGGSEPALIGYGSAPSLHVARARAIDDLARAAARYAGITVAAESEVSAAARSGVESEVARAATHAIASVPAASVEPDAIYWEQRGGEFQVYARARLPELAR